MSEPYPLRALRALRDAELDERVRGLSSATAAEAAAAAALEAAQRARAKHRDETERAHEVERARDAQARSAGALALLGAWLARRRSEEAALTDGARRAEETLAGARARTSAALAALAAAKAEVEALERHHATWEAERRAVRERRAEEEVDDVVRARAHAGRAGPRSD